MSSVRSPIGTVSCRLALVALLAVHAPAVAQNVAAWDFNGDLEPSGAGLALQAEAAPPAVSPAVSFPAVTIAGRAEQAASFSHGTYFRALYDFPPSGGGAFVNRYTLVLDVMYEDRSAAGGWGCLYNTNDGSPPGNDADWCINPAGGVGISGNYGGLVRDGEWHRLALVVDLVAGTYTSYIDGVQVQQNDGLVLDGRFAIYPDRLLLFADDNGESAGGLVDAVRLVDRALCESDVAALGGVADGPLPATVEIDLDCGPTTTNRLKEGPYLQWATQHAMTVMWETTAASTSVLRYRRAGADWQEIVEETEVTIHEVRLEGLDPAETVEYSVLSRTTDGGEVASETHTLTTAPEGKPPVRFVVWGDNQANPPIFSALSLGMAATGPDLALSCGDVVCNGDSYSAWGNEFLTPLRPLSSSVPFFVAIGNHERNSHWFYDYLAQPGNEHWFSLDYGGAHFVILDTNFPFAPGSEQYQWLEADLFSKAAQGSDWLLVFSHHPPYSEIYEETRYAQIRQHLVPLWEAAGVDVHFSGHIHDYERGVYEPPDTGRRIVYLQTSGGGGRLWPDEFDGEWEQIQLVVQFVYHYCVVDLTEESLTLQAVGIDGNVIDSFKLAALPRGGEPPPPPPPPPPSGLARTQWDFAGGDLAASFGPGTLEYADGDEGATAGQASFGTTEDFSLPAIAGSPANVLRFPKADSSMGFRVRHRAPSNAGGIYVNDYTLVLDLLLPAASFDADSWLGVYNTNASNSNDSEMFVRLADGGVGVDGQYDGRIRPDTWHRVALVSRIQAGRAILDKYVDGVRVGTQSAGGIDGRWSLYSVTDATPWFFLFTDNDGDSTAGYVSSVFFVDEALRPADIAALGGPDADGVTEDACAAVQCFRRGDANGDGRSDLSDSVFILLHLFREGARVPPCRKAADANDSGTVELSDAVFFLNFLFRSGAAPADPFLTCGSDPTADGLGCEAYPPCDA